MNRPATSSVFIIEVIFNERESGVFVENQSFEDLLPECNTALIRFVNYRLPTRTDAEDVLGQVYLTAFQHFDSLRNQASFKAWILRIAANACNDFYRKMAKTMEIEWNDLYEALPVRSRFGLTEQLVVRELLDQLADNQKQVLFLYYFKQKSIADIAEILGIPIGTVKSRLFTARESFKKVYLEEIKDGKMKKHNLPEVLPAYKIIKLEQLPFEVKWEELMGWLIVPRLGEKFSWGFYDYPSRKMSTWMELKVTTRAQIHGVEGVEIETDEHLVREEVKDPGGYRQRSLVAQLTETHCRILAETHMENGLKKFSTFLDGDDFLPNWGFGEDNCGNETNPRAKGLIVRDENLFTTDGRPQLIDVVGTYLVEINDRQYETICIVDFETYNEGVATEQYVDRNGRTVLWRRFNQDTWNVKNGQPTWTEKLPENERWLVNGLTYVHWYDCISEYIL